MTKMLPASRQHAVFLSSKTCRKASNFTRNILAPASVKLQIRRFACIRGGGRVQVEMLASGLVKENVSRRSGSKQKETGERQCVSMEMEMGTRMRLKDKQEGEKNDDGGFMGCLQARKKL